MRIKDKKQLNVFGFVFGMTSKKNWYWKITRRQISLFFFERQWKRNRHTEKFPPTGPFHKSLRWPGLGQEGSQEARTQARFLTWVCSRNILTWAFTCYLPGSILAGSWSQEVRSRNPSTPVWNAGISTARLEACSWDGEVSFNKSLCKQQNKMLLGVKTLFSISINLHVAWNCMLKILYLGNLRHSAVNDSS